MGNSHSTVAAALVWLAVTLFPCVNAFAPPISAVSKPGRFLYIDVEGHPTGPQGGSLLAPASAPNLAPQPFQLAVLEERARQGGIGLQSLPLLQQEPRIVLNLKEPLSHTDGVTSLRSSLDLDALKEELESISAEAEALRKSLLQSSFKRRAKEVGKAVLNFTYNRKGNLSMNLPEDEKPSALFFTDEISPGQDKILTQRAQLLNNVKETENYVALLQARRHEMEARSAVEYSPDAQLESLSSVLDYKPKGVKKPVDSELFQRSLLAERLHQHSKARRAAATFKEPGEIPAEVEDAAEQRKAQAAFALHRSLLEARLEMEEKARQAVSAMDAQSLKESRPSPLSVLQEPKASVSFSFQRKLLEKRLELANQTQENSPAVEVSESESPVRSSFTFQRALLKSRLELEAKAREKAASSAVSVNDIVPMNEDNLNEVLLSLPTRITQSGRSSSYVDQLIEKASVSMGDDKEVHEEKLTRTEVNSILKKAFTPEKDTQELKLQDETEILGFAATRFAWGMINSSKAAIFGVGAVLGKKTEENAVDAVADATQNFISAITAVGAVGVKHVEYGKEYAIKREVAMAKYLERKRQEEKDRRERRRIEEKLEEERIAEETRLEQERITAEEVRRERTRNLQKLGLHQAAFAKGLSPVLHYHTN